MDGICGPQMDGFADRKWVACAGRKGVACTGRQWGAFTGRTWMTFADRKGMGVVSAIGWALRDTLPRREPTKNRENMGKWRRHRRSQEERWRNCSAAGAARSKKHSNPQHYVLFFSFLCCAVLCCAVMFWTIKCKTVPKAPETNAKRRRRRQK
eukprot:gene14690-biopygen15690